MMQDKKLNQELQSSEINADQKNALLHVIRLKMERAQKFAAMRGGVAGEFSCPSCRRLLNNAERVRYSKSQFAICSDCFIKWTALYIEGYVNSFDDIVPTTEC